MAVVLMCTGLVLCIAWAFGKGRQPSRRRGGAGVDGGGDASAITFDGGGHGQRGDAGGGGDGGSCD